MSLKGQGGVIPFQSLRDYEEYIYTLRLRFPSVLQSTLVLIPRGRRIAILQGDLFFERGFRVSIKERLYDEVGHVTIEAYGYEMWRNSEKISWNDAQPHPDVSELQLSFLITNTFHRILSITVFLLPECALMSRTGPN